MEFQQGLISNEEFPTELDDHNFLLIEDDVSYEGKYSEDNWLTKS